jgi:2-iminobutanoate/2-iminopropanoate deaminase
MTESCSPTYLSFANTYTGAPYSHIVEFGRVLWLTGRTAKNPDDVTAPLPAGIEAQTHATMKNVMRLLADAGATLHDVVQARVFLTDFRRDSRR